MTWPNLLSTLRIAMVPVFLIAMVEGHPGWALALFGVAGLTDLLDGYLARFWHQQSVLGAYLDPAADKLLLTAAFVLLSWPGVHQGLLIPVWATVLVISRDVLIVTIALIVRLVLGITEFPPTWISKWNTSFQILVVLVYLLTGLTAVVEPFAFPLLAVMLVLTAASGLEYGYRFVYRSDDLAPQDDGDS